jgi:hypothetical protein
MVRKPGICDGGGETTVLAHYRLAGTCGTGAKPPDLLGAWCCGPCHEAAGDRDEDLAVGVMRTQYRLIQEGKIDL